MAWTVLLGLVTVIGGVVITALLALEKSIIALGTAGITISAFITVMKMHRR